MRGVLTQAWLSRGPLAYALWPLSLVMHALVAMRQRLYRLGLLRSHGVTVPVIVVGNVMAGGAGKTPVVIDVVRHLQSRGHAVGVISRGYGRTSTGCMEVAAESTASDVGDEPLLIARSTGVPVFVSSNRAEAAARLLSRHAGTNVIVMDDGLQHLAIARDIEICVFDSRAIGNGLLLPAGPLREPWPRHCDFMLHPPGVELARPDGSQAHVISRRLSDEIVNGRGERMPLASLQGKPVAALAGIAQPENFFSMLRQAGIHPDVCVGLPDHAQFEDGIPAAAAKHDTLLCTEKDAVKLWPLAPAVWAVPLQIQIDGDFWSALDQRLQDTRAAKLSSTDGHQTA